MLANTDNMVAEYLIYRGFNNTFKTFDNERNKDRTKQFEIEKIIESIFNDIHSLSIDNFMSLWEFLSKGFFLHLDIEHYRLSQIIRCDLLKYYLVNTIKQKNKDKTKEFFSLYSYELLSESIESFSDFKGWYTLPYIEEPEKDKDFSLYFTNKWMESLKITTHNFLSLVLHTAPLPKLLLLDRWFRSEAQQELRSQLDLSANKINTLISKLEENEKRLCNLHETITLLVTHVQKATVSSSTSTQRTSTIGLFETDEVAEKKKIKVLFILLLLLLLLLLFIIIIIII